MDMSKAVNSLRRAISELDDAKSISREKGVGEASAQIWRASAESEYALFILGLALDENLKTKVKAKSQSTHDAHEAVSNALMALKDALETFKLRRGEIEAYRAVFVARSILVTLQERMERGKI